MQRRLIGAGVRARYVPDAVVWHQVPPSKCSPSWTLDRARRIGAGLAHDTDEPEPKTLGVPSWMLQLLLRGFVGRVAGRPQAGYGVSYGVHLLKGFLAEKWRLRCSKGGAE